MKSNKEPKKTIDTKTKPIRVVKYKIYSPGESSFGYWIMPMTILVMLGLLYIGLVILLNTDASDLDTDNNSVPSIRIDNPFSGSNLFQNRQRAGATIDLNSTSWGKQIPITPPPNEE